MMSIREKKFPAEKRVHRLSGRPCWSAVCGLTLLLLSSPVTAAEIFQARQAQGDLLLVSAGESRRVEAVDGTAVDLPLSAQARVNDFRGTGGTWLVAAVDRAESGLQLVVLRGQGDAVEALPTPAIAPGSTVQEPVLLTDREGLRALLWLEGPRPDQLRVKAARRANGRWAETEVVSPLGRGSQLALAATVLGDGSWLAVWSAFDGEDDEIVWSRHSGGAWSAPQAIAADNQVPDITPHVVTTEDGALVAWSRYDGNDYRLQSARFDGRAWSAARWIGPKGSFDPRFSDGPRPVLTYRQAVPRAWGVLELDATGRVVRQTVAPSARDQRPVLSEILDDGVVLRWAGDTASSATSLARWQAPAE